MQASEPAQLPLRQPDASAAGHRPPEHASAEQHQQAGSSEQAATAPRRMVREDENQILVKGTAYTKLELVGKGGSCKVFKVRAQDDKLQSR